MQGRRFTRRRKRLLLPSCWFRGPDRDTARAAHEHRGIWVGPQGEGRPSQSPGLGDSRREGRTVCSLKAGYAPSHLSAVISPSLVAQGHVLLFQRGQARAFRCPTSWGHCALPLGAGLSPCSSSGRSVTLRLPCLCTAWGSLSLVCERLAFLRVLGSEVVVTSWLVRGRSICT